MQSGFDTYAFDGSKSAIERTKLLLKEEGLDVELKIADALNVEYPSQSFDVVIDNLSVLSNTLADINAMYKKIYNFLKPEGRTPEPIMPSQLPKVKLDMRETVKYARPPCETGLQQGLLCMELNQLPVCVYSAFKAVHG